jgi:YHS domain-containing protein
MSTDPVCGMEIHESTAPSARHEGVTYYFCSQSCLGAFQDDPEKFVDDNPGSREEVA